MSSLSDLLLVIIAKGKPNWGRTYSDSYPTNPNYKTAYEFDRLRINHVMFIKDRQKILVLSLFLYWDFLFCSFIFGVGYYLFFCH